jgi:hypothetical protein
LNSHSGNSMQLDTSVETFALAGVILLLFFLSAYSPWPDKVLLMILLAMALIGVTKTLQIRATDGALIFAIFCYFCFALLSAALTAEYFGLHSFTGLYELWLAHVSLVVGLVLAAFISQRQKDRLFSALMLALKLNIAFSLLQAVSGPFLVELMLHFSQFEDEVVEYRSGIIRTVGFFTNANTNAWFIALCLYYLMSQRKLALLWIALSLFALFSTGSRTVLFASLFIIGYQYAKNNEIPLLRALRKKFLYIFLLTLSIVAVASLKDSSTATGYSLIPDIDVITHIDEQEDVANSYFRAFALKTSMERFLRAPVVGWGPGNYGTPSSFRSHSSYLSEDGYDFFIEKGMTQLDLLVPLLLPETGIIGFACWAVLMFCILKVFRAHGSASPHITAVYCWCLLLIVNSFVGPGITHPLIAAMLPVLVAISIPNRTALGIRAI